MKYKLYEVGGHVRDGLLGIKSNDIDYTVVIEEALEIDEPLTVFNRLVEDLKQKGFEVFLETPDCFTIRAKFPKGDPNEGEVADFVLARKETEYIEGTRRPRVVLGTLEDDLLRRDFTVNAMAREHGTGKFVDIFNGQQDLQDMILRTTGDTVISFNDDPLRILRAFRFLITKDFSFSDEIIDAIKCFSAHKMEVVSNERIREELNKMFMANTTLTLVMLHRLEEWNFNLFYRLFRGGIRLEPTLKK